MTGTTVESLYRYPVKSMQGEPLLEAELTEAGFEGDRRWGVVDAETDKLLSAKTVPPLLEATAMADGTVVLPDGTRTSGGQAHGVLSEWLGRPVELREREDAEVSFQMTLDPPNDDADLVDIPSPPGSFFDLATVHLLSTASIRAVQHEAPHIDWDHRRFRPNLVIDGDLEPFAEDRWVGREVTVGDAVVSVFMPTVRCAMPLRAQPGLDRDVEVYNVLDRVHANHLGVYAAVVRPGSIRLGDAVVPGEG